MKKVLLASTIGLLISMTTIGQTYSSLWKQVREAQANDLPKTEQDILRRIADKARREQAYGQLLKAELQEACALCSVSPDSLTSSVERLTTSGQQAHDDVLKAIYNVVLGYIYENNASLSEQHTALAADYYAHSLANPDLLAATKAEDYEPLITTGADSRYFGAVPVSSVSGHAFFTYWPLGSIGLLD